MSRPPTLTEGQYAVLFNYLFVSAQLDEPRDVFCAPAWMGQRRPAKLPRGRVHRIEDDEP